jgi:hypothetical protein
MKQSHPAFWVAGWVGVVAGSMLGAVGLLSADELMKAVGGYGLVIAGCGLYLVAGLKIRQMVARRRNDGPNATTTPTTSERLPAAKQALTQR